MAGSDDTHGTHWRTASRFYRKPPGIGWLLALVLIPLLLGAIGYRAIEKSDTDTTTLPSVDASATLTVPSPPGTSANVNVPSGSLAPLSIIRNGTEVTVTGDVPDGTSRSGVLDAARTAFGPGVNVVDNLNLNADATAPDFLALGTVLTGGETVPDFGLNWDGETVTLSGTAASDADKAAIDAAAKTAWPDKEVSNEIEVRAAPAPGAPGTPGTPGGPGAGQCGSLQADITGLLRTPITFVTDGSSLTPATQQTLRQVADKIKACPDTRIAVAGYTDNTGSDGINVPLSASRAKSVADYLVSQGVDAGAVSSQGLGSANPIAANNTVDGRSQNRRVEITVS